MVFRRRKFVRRKYPTSRYPVKRRYKATRYRKRRFGNTKLSNDVSSTFPNKLLTKFSYTDSKLYVPLSGSNTYNIYNATNLYDPDQSGTGTAVLFYNNLINATLYRMYKVYATKVTISMVNESNFPCCAQIAYGLESTLSAKIAANPDVVDTYSTNKNNFIVNLGASTGGNNIRDINLWLNPAKIIGVTRKSYMADTDFQYGYLNSITPNVNRRIQFVVNILGGAPAGTAVAPSVSVTVHMKFYVMLSDFGHSQVQT